MGGCGRDISVVSTAGVLAVARAQAGECKLLRGCLRDRPHCPVAFSAEAALARGQRVMFATTVGLFVLRRGAGLLVWGPEKLVSGSRNTPARA